MIYVIGTFDREDKHFDLARLQVSEQTSEKDGTKGGR
jgi:hypothetical protein